MRIYYFYYFCIVQLFHFSEGKTCPEKFRPHKTRCDAYFKCIILPSKSHVWVPEKCDQGLIFEPNLKVCVLPGDDWECNIGDTSIANSDENNIYGIDLLGSMKNIEPNGNIDPNIESNENNNSHKRIGEEHFLEVNSDSNFVSNTSDPEIIFESSGDGSNDDINSIEIKEIAQELQVPARTPSKIDPKLTQHLQRLSQLIDGLKSTYQKNNETTKDLRPDQLNAFLAHFNIKNEFDNLNPQLDLSDGIKVSTNLTKNSGDKIKIINITKYPESLTEPKRNPGLTPETKVLLKNIVLPKRYRNPQNSYANSQIVVNRPEGSVLFSLSPNQGDADEPPYYNYHSNYDNEPRISEDTLKTVLELSKQMIENQNVRQILPNTPYYQPIIQPMYYPFPDYHSNYYNHRYKDHHYEDIKEDEKYEKITSTYINRNNGGKPTTIIQNSVIPVSIQANGEKGIQKPLATTTTEKNPYDSHHFDSYGNKVSDYILYPPDTFTESPSNYKPPNEYLFPNGLNFDITTEFAQKITPHQINKYYTPNPHLDNSNANSIFDQYPIFMNSFEKPQPIRSDMMNDRKPSDSYTYDPYKIWKQDGEMLNENSMNNKYSYLEHQPSAEEENYHNKNSVNKKIVNTRLALQNLGQNDYDKLNQGNMQLVNIGGSYVSYDVYKNQLLPALSDSTLGADSLEILRCDPGARQPNATDCTKYYVCSKDGKIFTYSCPAYTGFNSQSRICDARTYSICNPQGVLSNHYTVLENRKIQLEALKALQEAKRIRNEAIQAQNLANYIRLQTQQVINETIVDNDKQEPMIHMFPTTSAYDVPAPAMGHHHHSLIPKRRKYYCKDGDKIPDQTSVRSYYVCYKTKDGAMKGVKMTCSNSLMFCARTRLCTLASKCNA